MRARSHMHGIFVCILDLLSKSNSTVRVGNVFLWESTCLPGRQLPELSTITRINRITRIFIFWNTFFVVVHHNDIPFICNDNMSRDRSSVAIEGLLFDTFLPNCWALRARSTRSDPWVFAFWFSFCSSAAREKHSKSLIPKNKGSLHDGHWKLSDSNCCLAQDACPTCPHRNLNNRPEEQNLPIANPRGQAPYLFSPSVFPDKQMDGVDVLDQDAHNILHKKSTGASHRARRHRVSP